MNVIEKYLSKKEEYVVSYSKILSDFITINQIKLYKGKIELNRVLTSVTKSYLEKYYFEKDDTYILIGDYFNFNIKENKELNRIIFLIDKYFKDQKINTNEYKEDIFYLSTLISLGIKISESFNTSVDNRKYRTVTKEIIETIKSQNIIKFKKNKKLKLKELIEKIKNNNIDEEKFFNYFNLTEIKNKFKKVRNLDNAYYVKYDYLIESKRFKPEYVEKIFKREKINDLFLMISYEILTTTILKMIDLKNTNIKFIIPVSHTMCNNEQDIKKMNKIFSNTYLKNMILFIIDESIIQTDPKALYRLKSNDYKLCVMAGSNNLEIKELTIIHENLRIYEDASGYIDENNLLENLRKEIE